MAKSERCFKRRRPQNAFSPSVRTGKVGDSPGSTMVLLHRIRPSAPCLEMVFCHILHKDADFREDEKNNT